MTPISFDDDFNQPDYFLHDQQRKMVTQLPGIYRQVIKTNAGNNSKNRRSSLYLISR